MERLAARLWPFCIDFETNIAVCLPRGPSQVAAILAIWRVGGVYVPLDPDLPEERLDWQVTDCCARCVIIDAGTAWRPNSIAAIGPAETDLVALPPLSAAHPDRAAYVIYTSGSTGRPKGVTISHGSLVSYLEAVLTHLPASITSAAYTSTPAADLGHTVLFGTLWSGWTLHTLTSEQLADPDAVSIYMRTHAIDVLKIVPSHLDALLQAATPEDVLPGRCLILGGEAASATLLTSIQKLKPDCLVLNHYGPTEATVGVTVWPVIGTVADRLPLGRPLANSVVRVLDVDGNAVPPGVAGELCIAGAGLARGYLGRPGLTAERFVPDPHGMPSTRLYRTGDRARELPGGAFEFLGRLDDQVKIRGYRVEPEEVATVLRALPSVHAAAVIARPDASGEPRLMAFVVGDALDGEHLRTVLGTKLASYMVPVSITVMRSLPLTANGKIDRSALRDPEVVEATVTAPRTVEERQLLDIWRDVLKLERIGVTDNFFDLGGDSIRALHVVARARRAGLVLTPAAMLEGGTIERVVRLAASPDVADTVPAMTQTELSASDCEALVLTGLDPASILEVWPRDGISGRPAVSYGSRSGRRLSQSTAFGSARPARSGDAA